MNIIKYYNNPNITKEEHRNHKYFSVCALLNWNRNTQKEKYTKEEYKKIIKEKNITLYQIITWNNETKIEKEKFTKEEYKKIKILEHQDMIQWNYIKNQQEPFSKKEYIEIGIITYKNIISWNVEGRHKDPFTKKEFINAFKFNSYVIFEWNSNIIIPKFTNKETKEIRLIENNPKEITKEIFDEYYTYIHTIYEIKADTYKKFIKILKARNI